MLRFRFIIATLVLMTGASVAKAEDDPSCVRMPCLGKCMSKEDTEGKAFPMLCLAQSACYDHVDCTKRDDGSCGWKGTPELDACIVEKSKLPFAPMQMQR
jgi:hypothetical protein